ncbi:hypothetical protein [Acidisoma cladoniae]|uniref:hypothetical protein n=1 Tax=Acidisoma cladoniae TaxID=3040935 RepID=UPI00254AAAAF|nr:hypothetical protein [Acidisoma sp. PAMC 29798]
MGFLTMLASAGLSAFFGFSKMSFYWVVATAALWMIGYIMAKPQVLSRIRLAPVFVPVSLYCSVLLPNAICFGIGHLIGLA